MTAPGAGLWPTHEAMKGYLDSWARYAHELETRVITLETMSQRLEDSLTADVARLKDKLAECTEVQGERVAELEERAQRLLANVELLTIENQKAVEKLANVLEVPVTSSTTLQGLIGKTVTLVEHTKQQFRESL